MRRALLALVTAVAATAGLLVLPAAPASGLAGVSLADLAVSVEGRPASVAPPGAHVMYTVTLTNNGPGPSLNAMLTDVTTGGGTVVSATSATAGCSVSNDADTVICSDQLLLPGGSRSVDVVVQTPATAGATVVNTATASQALPAFDENTGNDTASVSTPVTDDTDGSHAFVPGGECIDFEAHELCVPESSAGVFVQLDDSDLSATPQCGNAACGQGLHIDFIQDPTYSALVATDPIVVTVHFTTNPPCHGWGNPTCSGLWVRKGGEDVTPPYLLPDCLVAGAAGPSPCLDSVSGPASDPTHVVNMLSNDPDLLKSLTGR